MSELTEDFDREQGPRYAAELDQCAELLHKIHPIGEVKAIGRLEVVGALSEMVEELTRLRALCATNVANDLYLVNHPDCKSIEVVGAGLIAFQDGVWRTGGVRGVGFDCSWTRFGWSGGVIAAEHAIQLRDWLSSWIDVNVPV